MDKGTCSIDGCGKPVLVKSRGWCGKHYQRWQKRGDPLATMRRDRDLPAPPCAVDDCDDPARIRGWCGNHYESWRKYGDPLASTRRLHAVTVGQHFGLWVITGPEVRLYRTQEKPQGHRAVPAKCSCPLGTERVLTFSELFGGKSRSCGCRRSELTRHKNLSFITHGLSAHPLYSTWRKMLRRCENPADKSWADYGGRGIKVHAEWHDVTTFVAWMDEHLGPRPAFGMSLDRVDVNGNYEPGNVRWADAWIQRHNRRPLKVCACGNINPATAKFCYECGTRFVT